MTGTNIASIKDANRLLEVMKPQLALAVPKHVEVDRLCRVILNALQTTPALLSCDRNSFMKAAMTVAVLGLEPEGVLGQAYLIPYKGQVQAQIGYRGYMTLARNSGKVSEIYAHEVHKNDTFDYELGLHKKLEHKPAEGERGEWTHVYAVVKFTDGGSHFDVLTKAQVMATRDNSDGYKAFKAGRMKTTPWVTHEIPMAKKTALRRISNMLPMTAQRAAAIDNATDAGKTAYLLPDNVIDIEAEEVQAVEQAEPEQKTSKLDTFEAALSTGEAVDAETGEVFRGDTPLKADAAKKTAA